MICQWCSYQHIDCYTVESQVMLQWSTYHQKLSDYRVVNMSWAHQSLDHHCHISHLQNFEHVMNISSVVGAPLSYQSHDFEHVMNTSVIGSPLSYQSFAELWTCHEQISHWITIVISVICRTLNMSWTHQSLNHHCHISYLQNFEHAITLAQ